MLALGLGGKSGCSRAVLEFMALPPMASHAYQQNLRHVRFLHYIIGCAHTVHMAARVAACLLQLALPAARKQMGMRSVASGVATSRSPVDPQIISCLSEPQVGSLHAALRAAAAEHHQPKARLLMVDQSR